MPDASLAGRRVKDVVLEMIVENEGMTVKAIAEKLDIGRGLVLQLCETLVSEGRLRKEDVK